MQRFGKAFLQAFHLSGVYCNIQTTQAANVPFLIVHVDHFAIPGGTPLYGLYRYILSQFKLEYPRPCDISKGLSQTETIEQDF